MAHLWEWYAKELAGRHTSNGYGANPLPWSELESWCRMTHKTPTPYELGILMRLDDCLVAAMTPKPKAGA